MEQTTQAPKKDNTKRNIILVAIVVLFLTTCISIASVTLSILDGNEDALNLLWKCVSPFVIVGLFTIIWLFIRKMNKEYEKAEEARMDREARNEERMRNFQEIEESARMTRIIIFSVAAVLLATSEIEPEEALKQANEYVGALIITEERMRKELNEKVDRAE